MKVHSLEGNRLKLDGGAMFGYVPRELWQKWSLPDEKNRISLASRSLFIETEQGTKILFEVGIGAFFEPKLKERYGIDQEEHILLKSLEEIGFSHQQIDIIILSHLHFDHAGGLLPAYGKGEELLFPQAEIWLSKQHWECAQNPHLREKSSFIPALIEKLRLSKRVKLIDLDEPADHPKIDLDLSFHRSDGHTRGLMLSEIKIEKEVIFFCSDLIPGEPWLHLPVTMGYDRFPELLVDEKTFILNMMKEKQATLFFTHDPQTEFLKPSINESFP